jgi:hypothetical protein
MRNLCKTIVPPLGGVPFDDEIYTLDTAKPLQFFKEDRVGGITPDPHVRWLHRRIDPARRFVFADCCAKACRVADANIAMETRKSRRFIRSSSRLWGTAGGE